MIKNVLVAVDGSEHSLKAVDYAIDIALKYGCKMYLLHVVTKVEVSKGLMEYADVERIEDPPEYLFFKKIGARMINTAEKTAKE